MFSGFCSLFLILTQLGCALIVPAHHVVHEKRSTPIQHAARVDASSVVPVRIGLAHSSYALDQASTWLTAVSDPTSEHFGKFWTQQEVLSAFSPAQGVREVVELWLLEHKISRGRMTVSADQAWLVFDATIAELELLLKTRYYLSGETLSCESYSLPAHVSPHVDYITPGVKGIKLLDRLPKRRRPSKHRRRVALGQNISTDLGTCDTVITPSCIRALYQISPADTASRPHPGNSLGIFEQGDYYSKADLDSFFTRYAPYVPGGTYPILNSINGGQAPVEYGGSGGESALDFEVAIPIVYPQTTTLYQVDDPYYARGGNGSTKGWFNTFLDALDGSYCTYSAFGQTGNDPVLDPTYPNPQGYNGSLQCGTLQPTNVISISYGVQEEDLPANYQKRQCNEFLKLGLQGVTIIVASGDLGVGSWNGHRGEQNGCLRNGTVFNPTQPCSCPYVTNVGATKIYPGKTVYDLESAAFDPAGHPFSYNFSSGGGFSNLFTAPAYQKTALRAYFRDHSPAYPHYLDGNYNGSHGVYNRNGRGIPDVAAVGDNIITTQQGIDFKVAGTSASAPIFAAMINRVIEERLKIGKGPLGFINPALYAHPWVFNDIVNGSNPGCGTGGFDCVPGWDPVTGLGTPSYPKLLNMFLQLP